MLGRPKTVQRRVFRGLKVIRHCHQEIGSDVVPRTEGSFKGVMAGVETLAG
jgi:hypothetical protein